MRSLGPPGGVPRWGGPKGPFPPFSKSAEPGGGGCLPRRSMAPGFRVERLDGLAPEFDGVKLELPGLEVSPFCFC